MVAYSEALQQVNLLTDTLKVLKLPYLEALTVADSFEMQHNMQEVIQHSKHFQWVTKRKVLVILFHFLFCPLFSKRQD